MQTIKMKGENKFYRFVYTQFDENKGKKNNKKIEDCKKGS